MMSKIGRIPQYIVKGPNEMLSCLVSLANASCEAPNKFSWNSHGDSITVLIEKLVSYKQSAPF